MLDAATFHGTTHRDLKALERWVRTRNEEPLECDMPVIDPHHHLWHDGRGRYLLDEFLEDVSSGHNIVATVYMQFNAMYRAEGRLEMQSVGEVEFANGVAAASASGGFGRTRVCDGIVGYADLLLGDNVQQVLEALVVAGNGRFRGIRHGATWDNGSAGTGRTFGPRHLMLDKAFRSGFARLGPMGLPFDAWLFYPQLPDLIDLLKAYPDTPVILDHLGGVLGIPPHVRRDEVFSVWQSHIKQLATFPNLSAKIGGLGMLYGGWDFHAREVPPSSDELAAAWRPYVEACVEAFGPDRCMFESNFPVDKQSCGYGTLWNAFKWITRNYSPAEKKSLYHDTAARAYRLHG